MTASSLASLAPPPGKTRAFWITRFQALSVGDRGEESYRIFYVGAESVNGGAPTFFAGSGDGASQAGVAGDGCTTTTPQNCKVVQYPPETAVGGKVVGNTFCINVPLSAFGANRPVARGATLYNVAAFSGGRNDPAADVYLDADSTRSFDHALGSLMERACDAVNVALPANGGAASASSVYPNGNYSPASATDGDRTGKNWGAGGGWSDSTRGLWPDQLEVTFNGGKALSEVRVYTLPDNYASGQEPTEQTPATLYGLIDFDVQAWDGTAWVTLPGGAVRGNDRALRVLTFPEVTTSKIRINVLNARVHFSRVVEVEAFGLSNP